MSAVSQGNKEPADPQEGGEGAGFAAADTEHLVQLKAGNSALFRLRSERKYGRDHKRSRATEKGSRCFDFKDFRCAASKRHST